MELWTYKEKLSWHVTERLTPSQWAERHRTLPASVSAEHGQLRLDRTPYIREILDCFAEPGVEEIVAVKAAQIGWSTAVESLVGYVVDCDPGPILVVLDSEKTAKEVVEERIRPLIENTEAVARHHTYGHESTLTSIKFDSCNLYMAWAGSAGSLARRAIRYVMLEEPDKYPANAGKEADPPSLARERTATYGYRRKILIGGTPTDRAGHVWKAWELAGDKRRYHVPCPHCGEYQVLGFPGIKWPKLDLPPAALADTIEQRHLATYQCVACQNSIHEQHRLRMVARGRWLSEGQKIDRAGNITGNRPKSKTVGFHVPAFLSPWRSFSANAAEFIRSENNPTKLQNVRNSWWAEPWEEVVRTANVDDFRNIAKRSPEPNKVPAWAEYLIAGADVQKDRIYWVVRAWGANYQSQLLAYGLAFSFEELRKHTLETQFQLPNGDSSRAHALYIDSGYRTDEVYSFAQTDLERIKCVKGSNTAQHVTIKYSGAAKDFGIPLFIIDTQLLKDKLATLRKDGERWLLHREVSDEYLQHLASEHKALVKGQEVWQKKTSGAANHWLDAEIYSLAGADQMRIDLVEVPQEKPRNEGTIYLSVPAPETPVDQTKDYIDYKPSDEMAHMQGSWLGNSSNWLNR